MPPPAVLVDSSPRVEIHLPGWKRYALAELPEQPFSLATSQIAVAVDVADQATAAAVLLAAARGVGVVLSVSLDGASAERFLDELSRVADVREGTETPGASLSVDHTELLDALASGLTVADAARKLGLSRRTAVRRLAEARARLGAASTTEAVRKYASSR